MRKPSPSIRVVPGIFQVRGQADFTPVIRFVDPDIDDEATREFFRVHLDNVDMLIDGIQRAAGDAKARLDMLNTAGPEDKALLLATSGGQA